MFGELLVLLLFFVISYCGLFQNVQELLLVLALQLNFRLGSVPPLFNSRFVFDGRRVITSSTRKYFRLVL